MVTVAPYGSWTSSISIEAITAGQVGLGGPDVEDGVVYWTESRASEGGRTGLWRLAPGGEPVELTPDRYVRSMVHEYGGKAWAVRDGVVVYSTIPDHQCFVLRDGTCSPLTAPNNLLRYGDFEVHPALGLVLAVREDHRASDLDCVNEIVVLRLDGDNPDGGTVLATGADFYAAPRLSPDGVLAWVEWDHPNMPWDSTRLMSAPLEVTGPRLGATRQIAGTATSAPCFPGWVGPDLIFLDDPSGFWNFYRDRAGEVQRLHDDDRDFCAPAWQFGTAWTALDDGRIVCTPYDGGRQLLGALVGDRFEPWRDDVSSALVGGDGALVAALISHPDRPTTLEVRDPDGTWRELRSATASAPDAAAVSIGESRTWDGPDGVVQAWYYPPTNPDFAAPDGELPPLKVLSHGGPTGVSTDALRLERQYWTSRGWAILDVNYGGSAAFGRAYRERLQGTWGVTDVRDCAAGAQAMVDAGLADPARLAIEGGSAGGYTTLAALTSVDTFTAGNCLYGIGDLDALVRTTHKFESRYLLGLIGGTPDEVPELYAERSPINHLDRLSCPMLIQQGEEDRIVPPEQAELMAEAVRAKGLPEALLMFADEGHGFRRAETIRASTEGALSFFGQVFGYEPPGVPVLPVENLR